MYTETMYEAHDLKTEMFPRSSMFACTLHIIDIINPQLIPKINAIVQMLPDARPKRCFL